jgi:hypothetical protein
MADDTPTESLQRQREAAAQARLKADDTYQTCQFIEQQGASAEVCALYHATARWAYNERKSVREMVALFRAGIHFALRESARREDSAPELAADLRGRAKAMAYDLAANTWPGWEDEGIELSPADLATGLEAAHLNLKLAEGLGRPDVARMHAHWLLGAQLLAQRDAESAIEQFEEAAARGRAAGNQDGALMAEGYAAIARLIANSGDAAAAEGFQSSIEQLRTLGSDDALFYANQLESVQKHFDR